MLSLIKAEKELMRLKGLDDGKDYCITIDPWAKGKNKYKVTEKTIQQKEIEDSDPVFFNTKITDWVRDYDVTKDIH